MGTSNFSRSAREVRFRKRLDAIEVALEANLHALRPERVAHPLRDLGPRPIRAEERQRSGPCRTATGRRARLRSKTIEDLDWGGRGDWIRVLSMSGGTAPTSTVLATREYRAGRRNGRLRLPRWNGRRPPPFSARASRGAWPDRPHRCSSRCRSRLARSPVASRLWPTAR